MTQGRRRGVILALGVLALTLCGAGAAEDPSKVPWPVFRGDARQTGDLAGTLPDKLELLWKYQAKDSIEGAPVVANGVVFFGSLDENLYAVTLDTGSERWKYKAGPIKASPATDGSAVYVGDQDGVFHCVDAAKGTKRWTFDTEEGEITAGANFAGDSVLFGSYGGESLYCLNKADGKRRWKFKAQGPINGSPAVVDGRTFVAGCDSALHILDVAKGKELASVDLGGQSGASAAVGGDRLYVGTMSNQFQAIDWKKASIAWTFQASERAQPFYSSAAVTDKLVVVGSRDRRVWALDRNTGKEAWSVLTRDRVDGSPVVVGRRVYVGSGDRKLYVLDLAGGKEVQRIALDGPITGSPAVAAGRLLIGTQKGTLYCLGARK